MPQSDYDPTSRRQGTPQHYARAVGATLHAVRVLADAYDRGLPEIARELSTPLQRLLTDELIGTRERRKMKVLSRLYPVNSNNILKQSLATYLEVNMNTDGQPLTADGRNMRVTCTHAPGFRALSAVVDRWLPFKEWWNEPILIEGAASGSDIPLDAAKQIPFSRRRKMNRREIIEVVRNKLGSHFDTELPGDAWLLQDPLFVEHIEVAVDGGPQIIALDTRPSQFVFTNHPLHAIVRHVAFEILESFAPDDEAGFRNRAPE